MLRFLRRLFASDSHPSSPNSDGIERRNAPRTSTASVLATKAAPQADVSHIAADELVDVADITESSEKSEASELSLEEPEPNQPGHEAGSDPYDTGSFFRPNAWNKATKRRND